MAADYKTIDEIIFSINASRKQVLTLLTYLSALNMEVELMKSEKLQPFVVGEIAQGKLDDLKTMASHASSLLPTVLENILGPEMKPYSNAGVTHFDLVDGGAVTGSYIEINGTNNVITAWVDNSSLVPAKILVQNSNTPANDGVYTLDTGVVGTDDTGYEGNASNSNLYLVENFDTYEDEDTTCTFYPLLNVSSPVSTRTLNAGNGEVQTLNERIRTLNLLYFELLTHYRHYIDYEKTLSKVVNDLYSSSSGEYDWGAKLSEALLKFNDLSNILAETADRILNPNRDESDAWQFPLYLRVVEEAGVTSIDLTVTDASYSNNSTISITGDKRNLTQFQAGDLIFLSGSSDYDNVGFYYIIEVDSSGETLVLYEAMGGSDTTDDNNVNVLLKRRPPNVFKASSGTTVNIDADNGSSKATLTLSGSTNWSSVASFSEGDQVLIIAAEDSGNNDVVVEIDDITDDVMTLAYTLTTDNTDDESIVILQYGE